MPCRPCNRKNEPNCAKIDDVTSKPMQERLLLPDQGRPKNRAANPHRYSGPQTTRSSKWGPRLPCWVKRLPVGRTKRSLITVIFATIIAFLHTPLTCSQGFNCVNVAL